MKRWISLFLCLLLIFPLNVYADSTGESETESQLSESEPPESQPSESQPPESEPPESEPPESEPPESEPPESQPPESQPPESQPPESQPPESQPSESRPTESTPSETIPSDHVHVWDVSYTVPATCKEEGATAYGCSACGAISVEVLPKLATHTYDNSCDPHCNICDQNREITHKFGTQWTKNSSGHWHACSVCGEKVDFGKHYPGPAATEEKAQLCLTCGYTLTAKRKHTHKYETHWSSDETGHWYACGGCDDQKDLEEHSYDNSCDPDCNICGYRTAAAHTYSGTWFSDENGHWDICTICQEKTTPEPHIFDPGTTETEAQCCIACGFERMLPSVPTEHIHLGEGNWLADSEKHWKLCSCGETVEASAHIPDAGTTQEEGTILFTCVDCGSTWEEESPKGFEPHTLVWIGCGLVVLLGIAAATGLLLFSRPRHRGKYGK